MGGEEIGWRVEKFKEGVCYPAVGALMEFMLVEKDKTEIKIEVAEADNTLIQPLLVELLADKNVVTAQLFERHPVLDKPILAVTVKSGNPETAIKKAAKNLIGQFQQALDLFEKEIG